MPSAIIKILTPWETQRKVTAPANVITLGDSYSLIAPEGINVVDETWDLRSPAMNKQDIQDLKNVLELLVGVDPFRWSPTGSPPYREFYCAKWTISRIGVEQCDYYRLSGSLELYGG